SRPIPDDDALQIRRPQSRLREHVIDELNDRGRVTARSLHKRSGRCASWRSDGDARDLSGGIDRQPATAHPRPSRTRNAERGTRNSSNRRPPPTSTLRIELAPSVPRSAFRLPPASTVPSPDLLHLSDIGLLTVA